MRVFDRLRRVARKMAHARGHDLGYFVKQDVCVGIRSVHRGKIIDGPSWYVAKCLKCNKVAMFSEHIEPSTKVTQCVSPTNPYLALSAIKATMSLKKSDQDVDLTDTGYGVLNGKALFEDCESKD